MTTHVSYRVTAIEDEEGSEGHNLVLVGEYPEDERDQATTHFDTAVRALGMGRLGIPHVVSYRLERVELLKQSEFRDIPAVGMESGEDPRT